MSNDLTLASQAQLPVEEMSEEDVMRGLSRARNNMGGDFKLFLNFDGRTGKYSYKNDDLVVDVSLGTEVAVNVTAALQGYTCWKANQPVDNEGPWSLLGEDPYEGQDVDAVLADHGPYNKDRSGGKRVEGWTKYIQLPVKFIESGKEFLFKISSPSGQRGVRAFLDAVIEDMAAGKSIKTDVPIVALSSVPFVAQGNKNFKPVWKITRWELGGAVATTPEASKAAFAKAQQNAATVSQEADPLSAMKKHKK